MLKVVYWSGSGNTEMMANLVVEGAVDAKAISMEDIEPEELADDTVFALGSPAMGEENLEELIVEPFIEELEKNISGKTIGLFGSYGWGDGQWMRDWVVRMQKAGATVVDEAGIICMDEPDDHAAAALKALGKKLAELQ